LPREEFGDEVPAFLGDIGELPRQFVGVGESASAFVAEAGPSPGIGRSLSFITASLPTSEVSDPDPPAGTPAIDRLSDSSAACSPDQMW
jgi:hypothetical protein